MLGWVAAVSAEVFRCRLGVDLDALDEEEAAVVRHLLHRLGALTLRQDHPLEKRLIGAVAPEAAQLRAQIRHERSRWGTHHVLLVEPQEFLGIEGRSRLVHIVDVERGNHLRACEHLLVTM